MYDDRKLVEHRIERLRERVERELYAVVAPLAVAAWRAPGEPVGFAAARQASFADFPAGTWWGPAWSTWWLRVDGQVPAEAMRRQLDLRVDLGFVGDWAGNQSEGMVFTAGGWPLKAVNPMNRTVPLNHGPLVARAAGATGPLLAPDGSLRLYVEAAANPDMTHHLTEPTLQGDVRTASDEPVWRFGGAEVVSRNDEVWGLWCDLEVLDGLMRELPEQATHRARLLRGLEEAADIVDAGGILAQAAVARRVLAPLVASGANSSAQRMTAVGHAHIDSAWLWPIRETRRKVLRTFSNAAALAEQYPDFHFAATSAQHYLWLQEASPEVFGRVREAIAAGQWHPVGGMWVESDTNLPGGESLVRQLTCGLRWMQAELGVRPDCLWLPDSFGYTGALPQIARLAGMRWFFTQKLSWNRINSLPHHTFWWEGIDGTRIWTHFPPVDCYDSVVSAAEVMRAERNFKEKGRAACSLLPFGYGDGGGGPVPEMMERVRRFADLEDAPRLTPAGPAAFFEAASAEYPDLPTWSGELYLEFHRGVYTTQHALKSGNRRSEQLLAAVELLATMTPADDYPADQLELLWRRLLLLQFHDILPGSSTSWVNREATAEFAAIVAELEELLAATAGDADPATTGLFNAAAHPRREVVDLAGELHLVEVPPLAVADLGSAGREPAHPVRVAEKGGVVTLDNGLVRVAIGADGTVSSIWDQVRQREVLLPGGRGNLLTLHPDHPSCFDAWELEEQYRRHSLALDDLDGLQLVLADPLRARVEIVRSFGDSRVVQGIGLDADTATVDFDLAVDWQERARVLKVGFPLAVRAARATAEIQFGHLERPVAVNTSWDQARFETSGQRWLLVPEPGYGIALANDSSYGHHVRPAGGPGAADHGVEVGLTLLRAPSAPDPSADLGRHSFGYSLTVDADVRAAHGAACRLNQPLRLLPGATPKESFLRLGTTDAHSFVVIDAVKRAFDGSGDVIVRLHEAAGARSRAALELSCEFAGVTEVDLLEEAVRDPSQALPNGAVGPGGSAGGSVGLMLSPFQILTLRLARSR